MKTHLIISFLILFFLSCNSAKEKALPVLQDKARTKKMFCRNERYFISLKENCNSFDTITGEFPIFGNGLLPAINFNELHLLSEVESYKNKLVKKIDVGVLNWIPLKYSLQNDAFYLPAFVVTNNRGHIDFRIKNWINIDIRKDSCFFSFKTVQADLGNPKLTVELKKYCDLWFKDFFVNQYEIKSKTKDEKKWKEEIYQTQKIHGYRWLLNIEVAKGMNLQRLKEPLDLFYSIYLSSLKENVLKYYKKDLCELTNNELRYFSHMNFVFMGIKEKE